MLKDFAIKATCTSIKNPQANAILERIHQVVGSMLKTKDLVNVVFDVVDPWSEILASIAFAVRCSHHSTLNATPGQLVFGRDMLLDITYVPNYQNTWQRKQKRINYDNIRENSKRVSHDYKVGEHAYILRDGNYRKLEGDKQGPYPITEDLRIDPSIKCRFADKSRMAFGWIKRPVRIASSKTRSRFILSCKNASGSAMASRFCNTEKPGFNFGFRRNTRSKTGSFFTCAA